MNSGTCFYGCGKTVWWEEGNKLKFEDSEMKVRHPYHPQGQQPTYKQSTISKPRTNYSKTPEEKAEIKQMHEANQASYKSLSDSNNRLAGAYESNTEAQNKILKSNETIAIELAKVAERLNEVLQKVSLNKK